VAAFDCMGLSSATVRTCHQESGADEREGGALAVSAGPILREFHEKLVPFLTLGYRLRSWCGSTRGGGASLSAQDELQTAHVGREWYHQSTAATTFFGDQANARGTLCFVALLRWAHKR
jgi:hypothetical protein